MKLRLASSLLLAIALGIAGYGWFRFLTWHTATELRHVRWDVPHEDWDGNGDGSKRGYDVAGGACVGVNILHGVHALLLCTDHHARSDVGGSGLWLLDYAQGTATLRYPASIYDAVFLPRSDDEFGYSNGSFLAIGGRTGWLHSKTPPTNHTISGLAWVNSELQAMHESGEEFIGEISGLDRDGTVRAVPRVPPDACWANFDDRRYNRCNRLSTFHDGQWWAGRREHSPPGWCWVSGNNPPVCIANLDFDILAPDLAVGRLPRGYIGQNNAIDWNKNTPISSGAWAPHAVVWQGATLQFQGSELIDADTRRFVVDGKNIDLTYKKGGRNGYEVFTPGNARAVASLTTTFAIESQPPPLTVQPNGRGGYFIADDQGRYATLDANLARTDHFDIWDYLRASGDTDRSSMPVMWPNWWTARWLGWIMYGPLVLALVFITIGGARARARRTSAKVPEVTAAPRRILAAFDFATWWVPVLLLTYVATACYGLIRVVPNL
jgi:hypothetical protein